ncbi:DUF4304 domain-containing protein [Chitinophaga sp. CC14]|uniref:hypothetical protein n=1 Tax=Chitinophaga sp. CC14 TaxID=3029199 RepID=UPI003B7BD4B4
MAEFTDYKKQLSKQLSLKLKEFGFSRLGMRFRLETEKFLFIIKIDSNRFKQLDLDFGLQPKAIKKLGTFVTYDFKKLDPIDCEIRKMINRSGGKPYWETSAGAAGIEKNVDGMLKVIKRQVMPVVNRFVANPDLFDSISPADLLDREGITATFGGAWPVGEETRTAWMFAVYYEHSDIARAKSFAQFAVDNHRSSLVDRSKTLKELLDLEIPFGSAVGIEPSDINETFFGEQDLTRILNKTIGKPSKP